MKLSLQFEIMNHDLEYPILKERIQYDATREISKSLEGFFDFKKEEVNPRLPAWKDPAIGLETHKVRFKGSVHVFREGIIEEVIKNLEGLAISSDDYILSKGIEDVVNRLRKE